MAHAVRVDEDNICREVHVINNSDLPNNGEFSPETEKAMQDFQASLGLTPTGSKWLLCSYNGNFRGRYAGIGYKYDEELDEFIAPEAPVEE
jgi:peptidoglycan hydrolase-like protein with peptidoglycan-binding domain